MITAIIWRIRCWLERRRNLLRYSQGQKDYEAAVGANLRYVENYLRKRLS